MIYYSHADKRNCLLLRDKSLLDKKYSGSMVMFDIHYIGDIF